jgi:hypothetical protein
MIHRCKSHNSLRKCNCTLGLEDQYIPSAKQLTFGITHLICTQLFLCVASSFVGSQALSTLFKYLFLYLLSQLSKQHKVWGKVHALQMKGR